MVNQENEPKLWVLRCFSFGPRTRFKASHPAESSQAPAVLFCSSGPCETSRVLIESVSLYHGLVRLLILDQCQLYYEALSTWICKRDPMRSLLAHKSSAHNSQKVAGFSPSDKRWWVSTSGVVAREASCQLLTWQTRAKLLQISDRQDKTSSCGLRLKVIKWGDASL